MEAHKELKVIESKGNYDLIRVSEGEYVVRKRFKSFFGFGKERTTFMVMDRVGLDFTYDGVLSTHTTAGLDRAQFVFNAKVLEAGGI